MAQGWVSEQGALLTRWAMVHLQVLLLRASTEACGSCTCMLPPGMCLNAFHAAATMSGWCSSLSMPGAARLMAGQLGYTTL